MRNFISSTMLMFLSIELSFSSLLLHHPRKPSASEEIFIQSLEPIGNDLNFECSVDSNETANDNHVGQSESNIWRDGLFVQLDSAFSSQEAAVINGALYDLHTVLCVGVRVWPKDSHPTGDYAYIKKDTATRDCFSWIGKTGGSQIINLGIGCVVRSVITHELIHAVGFQHEHKRPDRDNHVQVLWENIAPGKEYNFYKLENQPTFNIGYDVHSIMHYYSFIFTNKQGHPTILKKDGGTIPYNEFMTPSDRMKIRRLYSCE